MRHKACLQEREQKNYKAYSLLLGKVLAVGIEADPATVFGLDARRLLCFNHSLDNLRLNRRALSPAEMSGSYRAESRRDALNGTGEECRSCDVLWLIFTVNAS